MRQDKVVIALEQHELMLQALLALAQRVDPTAHRCHPLTEIEVKPFHSNSRS